MGLRPSSAMRGKRTLRRIFDQRRIGDQRVAGIDRLVDHRTGRRRRIGRGDWPGAAGLAWAAGIPAGPGSRRADAALPSRVMASAPAASSAERESGGEAPGRARRGTRTCLRRNRRQQPCGAVKRLVWLRPPVNDLGARLTGTRLALALRSSVGRSQRKRRRNRRLFRRSRV